MPSTCRDHPARVPQRAAEPDLTSTAVPNATRHYDTRSAVRADVVDARVWLGFHFRFADIASRNLGLQLSDWTVNHYFQPTHNH